MRIWGKDYNRTEDSNEEERSKMRETRWEMERNASTFIVESHHYCQKSRNLPLLFLMIYTLQTHPENEGGRKTLFSSSIFYIFNCFQPDEKLEERKSDEDETNEFNSHKNRTEQNRKRKSDKTQREKRQKNYSINPCKIYHITSQTSHRQLLC